MLGSNVLPLQSTHEMHLHHTYNFHFNEIVRAFIKKYNFENKFCMTTICSVKQLDGDRFQIVRRMDNVMSKRPLYERIIFDRKESMVHGYTFEHE